MLRRELNIRTLHVLLRVLKSADPDAAQALARLAQGLAQTQDTPEATSFWVIAAAWCEAMALRGRPLDMPAKRVAARLLAQCARLARGEPEVSERLAQDLLYHCAQARGFGTGGGAGRGGGLTVTLGASGGDGTSRPGSARTRCV